MDRSSRRNPRLQNAERKAAFGNFAAASRNDLAVMDRREVAPIANMNVEPALPQFVRSSGAASGSLSEPELIGLATQKGMSYPETLLIALVGRRSGGMSRSDLDLLVDDIGSHSDDVANIQLWLDKNPPFATIGDAIAALIAPSIEAAADPKQKTFAYAYMPNADKYVPYRPSGQAQAQAAQQPDAQQQGAGPSAEQVIGTAIGQGIGAANNLIREANATRRAEIEAEARVALAEIAARNGGAIPQSGQDAQTAAMLQLLMQQIAAGQSQQSGTRPATIALYVGGALLLTAAIGGIVYVSTRR